MLTRVFVSVKCMCYLPEDSNHVTLMLLGANQCEITFEKQSNRVRYVPNKLRLVLILFTILLSEHTVYTYIAHNLVHVPPLVIFVEMFEIEEVSEYMPN